MKSFIVLLFLPLSALAVPGFIGNGHGDRQWTENSGAIWDASIVYTNDGHGNAVPIGAYSSPTYVSFPNGSISVSGGNISIAPNTGGTVVNVSVTNSPTTITAPNHAVGFLLEAESGNLYNVRWASGSAASTVLGVLAEAGRDTGYVPGAADISVCSVSGTNNVDVQWILSQ